MDAIVLPRGKSGAHPRPAASAADSLTLERRLDGRLWALQGGEARAVWVRQCFPWSAPSGFLSLRDDDEEEFALVRDPAELDPGSRGALEEALVEAGFVLEVIRVLEGEEEVEVRHWRGEGQEGGAVFPNPAVGWPPLLAPPGVRPGEPHRHPPPRRPPVPRPLALPLAVSPGAPRLDPGPLGGEGGPAPPALLPPHPGGKAGTPGSAPELGRVRSGGPPHRR